VSQIDNLAPHTVKLGIKSDHGMKEMLRSARNALLELFKPYSRGMHHWKVARWRIEAANFARVVFKCVHSKQELSALIILLYSAFGAAAKRFNKAVKNN
jgi:hypothetical protein